MKELLIITAKTAPEDSLLEGLKTSIAKYEANKTPENKRALHAYCLMITVRFGSENETIESYLNQMERMQKTQDLLNPNKQ